ncbi:polysaccharide ABC transporter ATP-binding protein [Methanosarcina sp.]|uniref:ABC transporter ATP-binding protein n=1 Tax=Methanosarcina sp. TaxID=2213 RepID=UPI003C787C17
MVASKKNEPIIEVKHLSKKYDIGVDKAYKTLSGSLTSFVKNPLKTLKDSYRTNNIFWALKDVNFEVESGEVLGVIGRNGAGKSTLLKVLSRITYPTEGEVRMRGRVGSLLEVGTGFHPELSGRENIYFNGAILGMKKKEIDEKFDEIVKFSGVEKFLDTPVKRYSSGMNVRLAFSVAANLDPEILVVDEVLAVGDAAFQKKCLGKMSEVAEGGRTVLFVSHNMNAVEKMCTRCMVLDKGSLIYNSDDVHSSVQNYLCDSNSGVKKSEWINKGNELENIWFTPTKVYFVDENGSKVSGSVGSNTDIWIVIEANVSELDNSLTVGYSIFNEEDVLLYWSLQTDQKEDLWPEISKGENILTSKIPKRFLNEGLYRFEILASLHYVRWICQAGVDAPTVYLEIKGDLSDSPYWISRRPGVVAPEINWTKRIL